MKRRVDDLQVDMTRRQIMRDDHRIDLPDLSWRVFAILVERAPATVTYDELAQSVWRQDHVSQDAITQRVKLLRQSLGDDPASPRYVATERGVGYRLNAPVDSVSDKTPPASQRGRMPVIAAMVVITGALIFFTLTDRSRAPADIEAPVITATVTVKDLVARGREYLSRGSYDDNETALSLFEKALEREPENPDAIVGLSFAHAHRATKYDYGAESSKLAEALARRALDIKPQNGLSWHALGLSLDAQGLVDEALRAFEQAVAINPEDYGAISSAAYLLQVQGRFHEALLLEMELLNKERPGLFTLIQISLALRLAGFDDAAQVWLSRAETLTPDNILLAEVKAEFLLSAGNYEEAVRILQAESGNRRAAHYVLQGEALLALGGSDEAHAAFEKAYEQDTNNVSGRYELAALKISAGGADVSIDHHPLVADLRAGRDKGDQWPGSSVFAAYLYGAAGDADGAALMLRDACRFGYRDTDRLRFSPFFSKVRTHPAFEAALEEMENEIGIQRSLIANDQRLAPLLTVKS
ncbi:MAG: winged helix-turn-helix domain-containing protein [Pseudomonadota bacterium]